MEHTITTKKWYVVSGTAGDTVTSPDGSKIFCTVPEGGQGIFYATAPKVVTSNDSVEVVETTFNLAPVKLKLLGLLGGGVSTGLPSGYLVAEFLEFNNGNYIWSDFKMKNDRGIEVVYEYTSNSGVSLPMYACKSGGGLYCRVSHPDQNTGLWWDKAYDVKCIKSGKVKGTVNFKNDRKITNGDYSANITYTPTAAEEAIDVPVRIAQSYIGLLYSFRFSEGSDVVADLTPALDPQGAVCMFDKLKKKAYLFTASSGNKSQPVICFNIAQARKLFKLPAGGGTLTVSLPWEALDDASVQAALAKAAENGWTIVEQYREPEPTVENIAVDFLESTGEQYIDTGVIIDTMVGFSAKVLPICATTNYYEILGARKGEAETSYNLFVKKTNATTTQLRFDYGAGGAQRSYNVETGKTVRVAFAPEHNTFKINDDIYIINGSSYSCPYKFTLGKVNNRGSGALFNGHIYSFSYGEYINFIPTIDSKGEPCMFDTVSAKNFHNVGTGSFVAGFETVETARRLAKLPKVESGELTVSLPAEAREAASMVPTAISIAVSRGWTIIEQYRED